MRTRIISLAGVLIIFCALALLAASPLRRAYRHFTASPPPVPNRSFTTLRRPADAPAMKLAVKPFVLESRLVGRSLHEVLVIPNGNSNGRPLLVLLHGRGSKSSGQFLTKAWLDGLAKLGARAPDLLLVDGGDHSYYHDRADGRWGSYVMHEAIPAAISRLGANRRRIAIGGISMGGFGALDLSVKRPGYFCAAGGHSAALWLKSGETPSGVMDNAADFARNDVIGLAARAHEPFGSTRVWIDNGDHDPFLAADSDLVAVLRQSGRQVSFYVWPGSHSSTYWNAHAAAYLRFYADALAHC